jgi:hypothetical protein
MNVVEVSCAELAKCKKCSYFKKIDAMPITACILYSYFGPNSPNIANFSILTVTFTSHECFFAD